MKRLWNWLFGQEHLVCESKPKIILNYDKPELFEPLTFEEFAIVFDLDESDIIEIHNNELLSHNVSRFIETVNRSPQSGRRAYKIADERGNISLYRNFARRWSEVPTETGIVDVGASDRLRRKFNTWWYCYHGHDLWRLNHPVFFQRPATS